ncbi:aliphatic sulfonate ABC transporter substrate-binding protein [Rummeliibacillus suwonensis]|uniref:aliphatic sulfonate ABC transporter substrate-binding protein n=1 Tax=Rummeliibacillus suwonensis TaxID=1306154 RepID=UPI0028A2BE3A|nr:aliphatic sulfonate ABC transporter substrate-binding protein [Rummeliibacillus suwonensis]
MKNSIKSLMNYMLIASLLLLIVGCGKNAESKGTIRIGYQKNGTTLLLKDKGELEKALKEKGYKVEWSEFNTATSILEALNAKSIDFANAGDAPSVMALSKGMDFKYIASEPSAPDTEGILVRGNSNIKTVADLKGKKVAYNKASIAEYLLVQALKKEGLKIDDVESVILNPPDASVAFKNGEVDAWVVWDPYMTASAANGNRVIATSKGIVPYRSFYFATADILKKDEDVVKTVVKHIQSVGKSIDEDPSEAAQVLETNTGIKADTWITALKKKSSNPQYMDQEAITDLTQQAKELKEIGLIDQEVKIADYVWAP